MKNKSRRRPKCKMDGMVCELSRILNQFPLRTVYVCAYDVTRALFSLSFSKQFNAQTRTHHTPMPFGLMYYLFGMTVTFRTCCREPQPVSDGMCSNLMPTQNNLWTKQNDNNNNKTDRKILINIISDFLGELSSWSWRHFYSVVFCR